MKKETQNTTVKKHLLKGKKITTFQAFTKYGITRLASRIWDLRDSGMDIRSKRVQKKDTHYNEYFI